MITIVCTKKADSFAVSSISLVRERYHFSKNYVRNPSYTNLNYYLSKLCNFIASPISPLIFTLPLITADIGFKSPDCN